MPGPNNVIAAQLAQRRLSTRDKALQEKLAGAPSDSWQMELSPGNVAELMSEIQRQKDPKLRAVLQAELDRLRSLAESLGSYQPPPSTGGMQNLPYNPNDPMQRPQFQQRPYQGPPLQPGVPNPVEM